MKSKIKRNLIPVVFLVCLYACTGPKKMGQQPGAQSNAWKIVLQMVKQPLPQASKAEIKQYKAEQDTIRSTILLTGNFYKRTSYGKHHFIQIISRKDSLVYIMFGDDKKAHRYNYVKLMQNKRDTLFSEFRLFPDSAKTIHGKRSHKAVYVLAAEDSVTHTIWYSTDFPDWLWKNKKNRKVPGIILEQNYVKNHIKTTSKAVSIDRVQADPSRFLVPEDYAIVGEDGNIINSEEETSSGIYFSKGARDSVLAIVESVQPDSVFKAGSVFTHGFARIHTQDTTLYINASGKYVFDKIIARYHPIASVTPSRPGIVHIEKADSVMMLIVMKNGKTGLISSETGWALPPEYDDIHKDFNTWLAIKKGGKTGYADTWGNIKVPARFEAVNIMDGNYFDVKKGDKWGIYSAKKKQLVLPAVYDKFDYCGGCGSADYAYASKNGKWGVINFQGEVLVPFEYEHPGHYGMRGDEWVTSFEKDGQDVLINMATNKVYGPPKYTNMGLISGMLVLQKDGKYGFMSATGEQLTDFKYDDVSDPYGNFSWGSYIRVYINEKAGIINNKGEVIVPVGPYDMVNVSGDYFIVYKDGLQGILDASGQILLPIRYENIDWQFEIETKDQSGTPVVLYEIRNDTTTGFYNVQTDKLVEPQFSSLRLVTPPDSTQSYIEVKTEKEFNRGLYSIQGEEIMPPKYVDYYFLGDGFVETQIRGKYGLYDLQHGKEIAPPEYLNVAQISERFYYLKKADCCDANVKIWDAKKETFFSLPFEEVELAGKGLLLVNDTTNTYLYSLQKSKIISKGYPIIKTENYTRDGITNAEHGLFMMREDGKYGYINAKGEVIIPAKYDGVDMNKNGIIQLKKTITEDLLEYRYADTTGQFLSSNTYNYKKGYYYNYPYRFQDGNYLVISKYDKQQDVNLIGLVDLNGNEIVLPKYHKVIPATNGNGFLVKRYRKWGILDENGKVLIPPVLDKVYTQSRFDQSQKDIPFPVLCVIGDHYFYVTSSGKILPLKVKSSTAFYKQNRWGF